MANTTTKRKLGKGLEAIISTSPTPVDVMEKAVIEDKDRIIDLDVDQITPNPDQPRIHFDESTISGLAESIQSVGLIEPIIVRKHDKGYFVVAGERRLRAVKSLGLLKIRSVVIEADEEKNFTIALIENIQREDLDPMEEAKAYRVLINKFKLKQQDIAKKVGKDRTSIANALRLLNLSDDIQQAISEGRISTGHAKVLLSAPEEMQPRLFEEILEKGLSVRALEDRLKDEKTEDVPSAKKTKQQKDKEAHIKKMEEKLRAILGTKIEIKHSGTKGKIEISYYSLDDFERIVELMKG
ncbi:MAG: hypothetical protein CVV44_20795 [Spirochaetae bacterium HGW-Spirochaetae-1]|jgi:ParB family chromosome partitioning protein|nr:MAG: hypothetical protein CVV44_20795 [Spirochaetae bacterium HGW-Spirochaetae-1]